MKKLLLPYFLASLLVGAVISGAQLVLADTTSTSVTVSNSTPSVTSVTLNGGSAITLTENTTTSITITATITDANGCADVISSGTITIALYRSGATNGSACTTNDNHCYRTTSYSVQASDTCAGGTDTTANISSTINVFYFAEATDASSTYPSENWVAAVTAADAAPALASSTATVELNSLYALNVTGSIAYGSVAANADTGSTNQVATTTNTGNYKIDVEFSGTNMTLGANTIAASQQRYGTSTASYASLTFALSTTATQRDMNIAKATASSTPAASSTFWGIAVPNGQLAGSYTGTNTFTAVYSAN